MPPGREGRPHVTAPHRRRPRVPSPSTCKRHARTPRRLRSREQIEDEARARWTSMSPRGDDRSDQRPAFRPLRRVASPPACTIRRLQMPALHGSVSRNAVRIPVERRTEARPSSRNPAPALRRRGMRTASVVTVDRRPRRDRVGEVVRVGRVLGAKWRRRCHLAPHSRRSRVRAAPSSRAVRGRPRGACSAAVRPATPAADDDDGRRVAVQARCWSGEAAVGITDESSPRATCPTPATRRPGHDRYRRCGSTHRRTRPFGPHLARLCIGDGCSS